MNEGEHIMEAPRAGAPARDTGLPPGVQVGGLVRRIVAFLLDWLIPGVAIGVAATLLRGDGSLGVVLALAAAALAWGALCWSLLATRAATPGMRLMKLQLVGFLDGRPVGWGRVGVRWIVYVVLLATVVGWLLLLAFLLVHPRRQGWHDRAADAVLIVERPLAPPRNRAAGSRVAAVTDGPAVTPVPVAARDAEPADVDRAPSPTGARATSSGATTVQAPVGPTVPPPPTPASRSILDGWQAELDDGRKVAVRGLVLVGRNPQPAPGEEDAQLVKLADTSRTVSKTHVALGVDDAGLFVVDRGSTNGTVVTTQDRASAACPPHTAVSVEEGSVISVGDHWLRIRRTPS